MQNAVDKTIFPAETSFEPKTTQKYIYSLRTAQTECLAKKFG